MMTQQALGKLRINDSQPTRKTQRMVKYGPIKRLPSIVGPCQDLLFVN
jgi:hypothetical protein